MASTRAAVPIPNLAGLAEGSSWSVVRATQARSGSSPVRHASARTSRISDSLPSREGSSSIAESWAASR
eukprot:scaffold24408_cov30-Tisochrysis_lutea.AAC.3